MNSDGVAYTFVIYCNPFSFSVAGCCNILKSMIIAIFSIS